MSSAQTVTPGGQVNVAPYQKGSIGGSALQLNTGTANANVRGIEVKALAANTTYQVYVGLTGVTTSTGFELSAGESLFIPPSMAANDGLIYVIGNSTGLAVCVAVY